MRDLVAKHYGVNERAPLLRALEDMSYDKMDADVVPVVLVGSQVVGAAADHKRAWDLVGGAMEDVGKRAAQHVSSVPWRSVVVGGLDRDIVENLSDLDRAINTIDSTLGDDPSRVQRKLGFIGEYAQSLWRYIMSLFKRVPDAVAQASGESEGLFQRYMSWGVSSLFSVLVHAVTGVLRNIFVALRKLVHTAMNHASALLYGAATAAYKTTDVVRDHLRGIVFLSMSITEDRLNIMRVEGPDAMVRFEAAARRRFALSLERISNLMLDKGVRVSDDALDNAIKPFGHRVASFFGGLFQWIIDTVSYWVVRIYRIMESSTTALISSFPLLAPLSSLVMKPVNDEVRAMQEDVREFQELEATLSLGISHDSVSDAYNADVTRSALKAMLKSDLVRGKNRTAVEGALKALDDADTFAERAQQATSLAARGGASDRKIVQDNVEFARVTKNLYGAAFGNSSSDAAVVEGIRYLSQNATAAASPWQVAQIRKGALEMASATHFAVFSAVSKDLEARGKKKQEAFRQFGRPRPVNAGSDDDDDDDDSSVRNDVRRHLRAGGRLEGLSLREYQVAVNDVDLTTMQQLSDSFDANKDTFDGAMTELKRIISETGGKYGDTEKTLHVAMMGEVTKVVETHRGNVAPTQLDLMNRDDVRESAMLRLVHERVKTVLRRTGLSQEDIRQQLRSFKTMEDALFEAYGAAYGATGRLQAVRRAIIQRSTVGRNTKLAIHILLLIIAARTALYFYMMWIASRDVPEISVLAADAEWSLVGALSKLWSTTTVLSGLKNVLDDADYRSVLAYGRLFSKPGVSTATAALSATTYLKNLSGFIQAGYYVGYTVYLGTAFLSSWIVNFMAANSENRKLETFRRIHTTWGESLKVWGNETIWALWEAVWLIGGVIARHGIKFIFTADAAMASVVNIAVGGLPGLLGMAQNARTMLKDTAKELQNLNVSSMFRLPKAIEEAPMRIAQFQEEERRVMDIDRPLISRFREIYANQVVPLIQEQIDGHARMVQYMESHQSSIIPALAIEGKKKTRSDEAEDMRRAWALEKSD